MKKLLLIVHIALLSNLYAASAYTYDDYDASGLELLSAARDQEEAGFVLEAMLLASKAIGYCTTIDCDTEEYPILLDINTPEYMEARDIVDRYSSILQWSTPVLGMQNQEGLSRAVWSPDGKYIAAGNGIDQEICIWDAETGAMINQITSPFPQLLNPLRNFAWSPDGLYIAAALSSTGWVEGLAHHSTQDQCAIYIWDVTSGNIVNTLQGPEYTIESIGWSHNGNQIAAGSYDGILYIWDLNTNELLQESNIFNSVINFLEWSPDDLRIAVSDFSSEIFLVDIASNNVYAILPRHARLEGFLWSPDGSHIITFSGIDSIQFWDTANGSLIKTIEGYNSPHGYSQSFDGAKIAVGDGDRVFDVIDANNGTAYNQLRIKGRINSLSLNSDGSQVASTSISGDENGIQGFIMLWDLIQEDNALYHEELYGDILNVSWGPSGEFIATGGVTQPIRIWDAHTGALVDVLEGRIGCQSEVSWSPDGQYIASSSREYFCSGGYAFSDDFDRGIIIWDSNTGIILHNLLDPFQDGRTPDIGFDGIAWSPDGRFLAASYSDGIYIWDTSTWNLHQAFNQLASSHSIAWSPNGVYLAYICHGKIQILNTMNGDFVAEHSEGDIVICCFSWNDDGTAIISGDANGSICIWDVASGNTINKFIAHNNDIRDIAWSSHEYIASIGSDSLINIWDAASYTLLYSIVREGWDLSWSPDGVKLAANGYDLRVWDLSTSCQGKYTSDFFQYFEIHGTNVFFPSYPEGEIGQFLSIGRDCM